ncbi:sulfurtransferase [beta proteobacterium MWH-UniP1]
MNIAAHLQEYGSRIFATATITIGLMVSGQAIAFGPIVSPQELKTLASRGDVRILDIRETQGTPEAPNYDAGHIPGSVSAPYSSFRGNKSNPGRPVPEAKLSALLGTIGVTPDTKIVITNRGTDATDFGAAARVYWTLKVAGLKSIAILDGGLKGWASAGYALSTEKPSIKPTTLSLKYDESAIVTTDEVSQALGSKDSKTKLVDARPAGFFKGEVRHDAASRYGTLPGAQNFSHDLWFLPKSATLKPRGEIESLAKRAGLIHDQETVSFCNTGHWAATNWFVLSEVLGQKGVKMYPESVVAWSKTELPLDNEPGRVGTLWRDLKRIF